MAEALTSPLIRNQSVPLDNVVAVWLYLGRRDIHVDIYIHIYRWIISNYKHLFIQNSGELSVGTEHGTNTYRVPNMSRCQVYHGGTQGDSMQ